MGGVSAQSQGWHASSGIRISPGVRRTRARAVQSGLWLPLRPGAVRGGGVMRFSYLICYDICDDKRLRKVFQTMRGFGDHLQFSVFERSEERRVGKECRSRWSAY